MARRYLRGPEPESSGGNYHQRTRGALILLYFYYRYLLGYTYVDQQTGTSSFDFDGCQEDEGTDGVLTAVDTSFSAASASFIAGHQDWFIVTLDNTNEKNCGIFKILSVDSSIQVTVDFYSGNFPAANSGINWWLVNSAVGASLVDNEGVVLRGNHTSAPYEIFLYLYDGGGFNDRFGIQYASVSGAWDTVGHAWKTTLNNPVFTRNIAIFAGQYGDAAGPRIYAVGDTDFKWNFLMFHAQGGTAYKHYANWGVLDPMFEALPARTAPEKFAAFGQDSTFTFSGERDGTSRDGIGYGEVWSARRPSSVLARWCGWYDSSQDYFKRALTEVNHREGSEYDGLPIWVQGDADPGQDSVWSLWGAVPKDELWLTACAGIGELTTFGSNQYMHWVEGISSPWPGVGWM
jgi:hypothetical protein